MLCHHECKEGSLILCHPEHKRRISILYVILSLSEGSHEILRAKALRMTIHGIYSNNTLVIMSARKVLLYFVILSLSEGSHEILRAKALRMTLKERIIHEIFLRGINTKKL